MNYWNEWSTGGLRKRRWCTSRVGIKNPVRGAAVIFDYFWNLMVLNSPLPFACCFGWMQDLCLRAGSLLTLTPAIRHFGARHVKKKTTKKKPLPIYLYAFNVACPTVTRGPVCHPTSTSDTLFLPTFLLWKWLPAVWLPSCQFCCLVFAF